MLNDSLTHIYLSYFSVILVIVTALVLWRVLDEGVDLILAWIDHRELERQDRRRGPRWMEDDPW